MEPAHMFWGVVLKPEKRYEQLVEEPFHISKACIEPSTSKGTTSVFIEVDDEEFIICNLTDKILNENLDLNFNFGDKIVFRTSGNGTVHLTGYNIVEDDGPGFGDDSSDDESGEDEEVPQLVNGKNKRKRSSATSDELMIPSKKSNKDMSPLDKLLADKKKAPGTAEQEKKQAEDLRKKLNAKKGETEDIEDTDGEDDSDGEEEEGSDEEDFIDDEAGEEEEADSDDDGEEEEEEEDMETESPEKSSPEKKLKKEIESPKKSSSEKEQKKNEAPAAKKKEISPKKEKKTEVKPPETPETSKSESSPTETQSAKKKKKKNKKKNKENETNTTNAPAENEQKTGQDKTPLAQTKPGQEKTPGATGDKTDKTPGKTGKPEKTPGKTPKRTLKGGLMVEDLKIGNGPDAKKGKMIGMYYDGKLKSNQKRFDATLNGKPFKFRLGSGEVIKGWDVGIEGMKVGGKRRLTVPPQLAYGASGAPPDIPPNATLIFDVECKAVN